MKTVLIVEDIDLNIDLITQLLEEEYSLLVAKDGAAAVVMAEEKLPDLVIMDIALPIMDGYEATRRIRARFPALPIIGLSSHAMSGDAEKARAAGCNDYLTKPIDEDLLIATLRRYLG